MSIDKDLLLIGFVGFTVFVHILCAVFLAFIIKQNKEPLKLWPLAGLFGGLLGVGLYFYLKTPAKKAENSDSQE